MDAAENQPVTWHVAHLFKNESVVASLVKIFLSSSRSFSILMELPETITQTKPLSSVTQIKQDRKRDPQSRNRSRHTYLAFESLHLFGNQLHPAIQVVRDLMFVRLIC